MKFVTWLGWCVVDWLKGEVMEKRPLAGKTTLVVENELWILINIEQILTRLGCRVITAKNAGAALVALENEKSDFAFIDFGELVDAGMICFVGGLRLLHIPFAFVTGEDKLVVESACCSDVRVIPKPFEEEWIVEAALELASQ